jgi:hypothetical protein
MCSKKQFIYCKNNEKLYIQPCIQHVRLVEKKGNQIVNDAFHNDMPFEIKMQLKMDAFGIL